MEIKKAPGLYIATTAGSPQGIAQTLKQMSGFWRVIVIYAVSVKVNSNTLQGLQTDFISDSQRIKGATREKTSENWLI